VDHHCAQPRRRLEEVIGKLAARDDAVGFARQAADGAGAAVGSTARASAASPSGAIGSVSRTVLLTDKVIKSGREFGRKPSVLFSGPADYST